MESNLMQPGNKRAIRIVLITAAIAATALLGRSMVNNHSGMPKVQTAKMSKAPEMDPLVLKTFREVSARTSASRKELLLQGRLSNTDGADSAQSFREFPYLFSRKGDDYYFRLGTLETYNADGLYVQVDRAAGKVLVSGQKSIAESPGIPSAEKLMDNLTGDGYTLISSQAGTLGQISFRNEHHINCREYAISYDTASLDPREINIRICDPLQFENPSKDKRLRLQIEKLGNESEIGEHRPSQVVIKKAEGLVLAEEYKQFELIIL